MKKNSDEPVFEVESPDGWTIRVPESKLEEWSKKQAHNAGQRRELTDFEKRVRDRIVSMVYDSDDTSDPSGASDPPIPTPTPSSPDPEPEYTLKDNTSDPSGPSGTSDLPTPTPEPSSPEPEPEYKLKWDTFVTFVILPLTILNTASYSLLYLQSDRTDDILFGSVTMFTLLTLVLAVVSFVGLLKRRWYGPCSFSGTIASGLLADLISIPLLLDSTSPTALAGTIAGSFLVRIIIGILTWIYYKRRRPLFAPPPAPKSAHIPTSSEKESAPRLFKVPPFPFFRKKEEQHEAPSPSEPRPKRHPILSLNKVGYQITIIVLIGLLLISSLFGASTSNNLETAQNTIEELENKIANAYDDGYSAGHTDGYDEGSYTGYDAGYEEGQSSGYDNGYADCYLEHFREYTFFRNGACIVTVSGSKYHHWGCYHIDGSRYYIYNVELAVSYGYEPCEDCWEYSS